MKIIITWWGGVGTGIQPDDCVQPIVLLLSLCLSHSCITLWRSHMESNSVQPLWCSFHHPGLTDFCPWLCHW